MFETIVPLGLWWVTVSLALHGTREVVCKCKQVHGGFCLRCCGKASTGQISVTNGDEYPWSFILDRVKRGDNSVQAPGATVVAVEMELASNSEHENLPLVAEFPKPRSRFLLQSCAKACVFIHSLSFELCISMFGAEAPNCTGPRIYETLQAKGVQPDAKYSYTQGNDCGSKAWLSRDHGELERERLATEMEWRIVRASCQKI